MTNIPTCQGEAGTDTVIYFKENTDHLSQIQTKFTIRN